MNKHPWNDHFIEIKAKNLAKLFWLSTSIKVYIDGLILTESPNSLNRGNGSIKFALTDNGVSRNFRVEFDGRFSIAHVKYKIYIDDGVYVIGKVLPNNWYMIYLATFLGLIVSLILETI